MTSFDLYKLYLAIKLHFTSEKYDVVANRGRIKNCSETAFNEKPISKRFFFLTKTLSSSQEAAQFFVACFAYNADIFDSDAASQAFFTWKKNKEMMTQLILDDVEKIGNIHFSLEGDPCKLQQLVAGGHVNIETAVALNKIFGFTANWKNNFAYKQLGIKIEKLNHFVKFNEKKIYEAVECYEQQAA